MKHKKDHLETVGQKPQWHPWIGIRNIRSIPRCFSSLHWLFHFFQNVHHHFAEAPKGCRGAAWLSGSFLVSWLLPRVDHREVEGSFGVLWPWTCSPINVAVQDLLLNVRWRFQWWLNQKLPGIHILPQRLLLNVRLQASLASACIPELPSSQVSPGCCHLLFACTFCPSCRPHLAEPPASHLPGCPGSVPLTCGPLQTL